MSHVRVHVTLPAEFAARVATAATEAGSTMTGVIRMALDGWLRSRMVPAVGPTQPIIIQSPAAQPSDQPTPTRSLARRSNDDDPSTLEGVDLMNEENWLRAIRPRHVWSPPEDYRTRALPALPDGTPAYASERIKWYTALRVMDLAGQKETMGRYSRIAQITGVSPEAAHQMSAVAFEGEKVEVPDVFEKRYNELKEEWEATEAPTLTSAPRRPVAKIHQSVPLKVKKGHARG